jgi:poly(A) polymerase
VRIPTSGPSELAGLNKTGSTDPVNRMCAYLGYNRAAVADLAETWRWSTDERDRAAFITENRSSSNWLATYKRHLAVGKIAPDRVIELALADGRPGDAKALREWPVPRMPLNGDDLIRLGYKPGEQMGQLLKALTDKWAVSEYQADKTALMSGIKCISPGRSATYER